MSQSPLAQSRVRGRKSLTAFARPPSQLSRSTSVNDFNSPSPSPPRSDTTSSQNAFATPPRRAPSPVRRYRDSGVGMTTPVKLTYSPFQTPPSGMSKSSSMPFDFAANARAARQAENDRLRAANDALPKVKKQRFVRRKALWQRLLASPAEMLDSAIFQIPSSVQEILPPEQWANPISLFLYIVHWLLLAPLRAGKTNDDVLLFRKGGSAIDDRWNRFDEETKVGRRGLVGWRMALLVTILLFALSAANAFYLFTRFRSYDMQLRAANDPVPSPHASPIPAPRVKVEDDAGREDQEEPSQATEPIVQRYARTLGHWAVIFTKWLFRAILSAFGARPPATSAVSRSPDSNDRIQSLRIWDPPEFCLAFFCAFPPSAPIIAYFLTAQHPFILPLLHMSTAILLTHLASSFHRLVKDKQLLYSEVQREYDHRFVYKQVLRHMVDRAVGTSDSILGA